MGSVLFPRTESTRVYGYGRAVMIQGFRKTWYSACVRAGLGEMVLAVDVVTGKLLYERPRGPRSRPKPKTTIEGRIFHDLRRSAVRNMIRAGVSDKVAMQISGHRTPAMLWRYDITDTRDVVEAGKRTEKYLADVQARPEAQSSKRRSVQ